MKNINMKYLKTKGFYKGANVSFDPEKMIALSYGWWCFVSIIEGKLIFNDYSYSVSTSKHQRKVKRLLDDLGFDVDRFVSFRESLDLVSTIDDLNMLEAKEQLIVRANKERDRLRKNKRARERRSEKKAKQILENQKPLAQIFQFSILR